MIISHRHKYIYFKTRKTASTSLEIALSKYAGPEDVITDISPEDEKMRADLGYRGMQNFHLPLRSYDRKAWKELLLHRKTQKYTNHTPAKKIQRHVPPEIWNSYFKFTLERNPYDKAVSAYFWRTRDMDPKPSIREFLATVEKKRIANFEIYSIKGQVVADYVGRYETLAESIEEIRLRIGLPEPLQMPQAKSQFRSDTRSYRELLGPDERAMVENLCREEIETFGYRFE